MNDNIKEEILHEVNNMLIDNHLIGVVKKKHWETGPYLQCGKTYLRIENAKFKLLLKWKKNKSSRQELTIPLSDPNSVENAALIMIHAIRFNKNPRDWFNKIPEEYRKFL